MLGLMIVTALFSMFMSNTATTAIGVRLVKGNDPEDMLDKVESHIRKQGYHIVYTEPDMEKWVEFNRKYSEMWPVIITKKDPLPEAEERDGETGKLEKYFSEAAGEGG